MNSDSKKEWSQSLCELTTDIIENLNFRSVDSFLYMKHIDGGKAVIALSDLLNHRLRLVNKDDTSVVAEFSDIKELLGAGWAVD